MSAEGRIERRFAELADKGRTGLVTFITAGDPNPETSLEIVCGLPQAGADIIELGMPFTDPMADGPSIQAASLRALSEGASLRGTLDLVRGFRAQDAETPVVLMGYYNPIYVYGVPDFVRGATEAGVDGLIIVDLPPEEDSELCQPALDGGLRWIRLATPTTDEARLPRVLENASGFLYYVAIAGITGTRSAGEKEIAEAVSRLRAHTPLPLAVGFGIRTAEDVGAVTRHADAAVVGSAIVDTMARHLDSENRPTSKLVGAVHDYVRELASGVTAR